MEKQVTAEELSKYRDRCQVILDVRSPGEFAEDHMPGARNVPMLNDAQRAEVGTLHRQDAFAARKLGAHYTTGAICRMLAEPWLANASRATGFMVYCARGGQRSGALATVLSQIGFPVFRLRRGYKTYRRYVLERFHQPLPQPVYVLYGYTGSGKTLLLQRLRDAFHVIDLEGAAHHRGSILGGHDRERQPSQRQFETQLALTLECFQSDKPLLLEGESRKVGLCRIPKGLWQAMVTGIHLWVDIPRATRRALILDEYADLKNSESLQTLLPNLNAYLPKTVRAELSEALGEQDWPRLVELLLVHHYDPLYARANKKDQRVQIPGSTCDEAEQALRTLALHGPERFALESV